MTTLFNAMLGTAPKALTANGALTNATSMNAVLDLFNIIGSSRGKDITSVFANAFNANSELTIRVLLHARDCRGGSGERDTVRKLIRFMLDHGQTELAFRVIARLPEIGYWKDVIELYEPRTRDLIHTMITKALKSGDGLCAKYMPRKGEKARMIRKHLGWNEHQWRKVIVKLSKTVEQQMCARDWSGINYEHVPSLAARKYSGAFKRNDNTRYTRYLEAVNKGEAKINAGTLTPVEVALSVARGTPAGEMQWKALPNYLEGSSERILPVVDVSGSMNTPVPNTTYSCMDVSVALGIYLAERGVGAFKDQFVTFSESPTMVHMTGNNLRERLSNVRRARWGYNTDIQKTFNIILQRAVAYQVPEHEMPTMLVILSDMEFDTAMCGSTNYEAIRAKYAASGYKLPKIVFWNLNARAGNNPVTVRDDQTCMVSGFNPAIMTSVLSCKDFNPFSVMVEAVMKPRYDY